MSKTSSIVVAVLVTTAVVAAAVSAVWFYYGNIYTKKANDDVAVHKYLDIDVVDNDGVEQYVNDAITTAQYEAESELLNSALTETDFEMTEVSESLSTICGAKIDSESAHLRIVTLAKKYKLSDEDLVQLFAEFSDSADADELKDIISSRIPNADIAILFGQMCGAIPLQTKKTNASDETTKNLNEETLNEETAEDGNGFVSSSSDTISNETIIASRNMVNKLFRKYDITISDMAKLLKNICGKSFSPEQAHYNMTYTVAKVAMTESDMGAVLLGFSSGKTPGQILTQLSMADREAEIMGALCR